MTTSSGCHDSRRSLPTRVRGTTIVHRESASRRARVASLEDDSHSDRPPVPSFMPDSWVDARREWGGGGGSENKPGKRSRESRIRDFRHAFARTAVTIATLGAVNLMFSPEFLWFLFPTAFMGLGMLRRAGSLWADGIRIRDVLAGKARDQLGRSDAPLASD